MEISQNDAQNCLKEVEIISSRTHKAVVAAYDPPILIVWGLVCIIAYIATHFFLKWAWPIWIGMGTIGSAATFLICRRQFRTANPTKIVNGAKLGWQFGLFWGLLYIFIFLIWLPIMAPFNGLQCNAFIITVIMFAYMTIGLWSNSRYMIWLGLAVTCTTLVGFYLIPHNYYCLWMAATAGGALLGTGVYIQLRWK
jgi:hypothetical protein